MKAILVILSLLLGNGVVDAQEKTITKVVKLLQDMLDKSKEEGDEERKIYGKFKCYCDSSEATKTENIKENTKLISLLESKIEELQGSNGEMSSQCADLKASMAKNEQQREEAVAIREKQSGQFKDDKADFTQAIGQMNEAVDTLTKVGADQTASTGADNKQFMAGKSASLLSLQSSMKNALSGAEAFMNEKQYKSVTSFMQAPFTGTYTSQSGQVMGIIKNMRDTFEANLVTAISTEKSQLKSHNAFMKVKEDAHADMSRLYEDAQGTLGDNDGELSSKRGQLKEAEESNADDETFLEKLRPMCKDKAAAYEKRKLLRANEEVAVAEAISILNSDSAFDTFSTVGATSTGGTSFLQVVQKHLPGVSDADVRQVMQRLLRRAAVGRSAPRLVHVISALQAENPFDTVLDEIDKMIELIGEEGKADKKKFEWCKDERLTNKQSLGEKNDEILALEGKIDELTQRIHDPVQGLHQQIENTEISLEENHEGQGSQTAERQEANKAYQADVKNLVSAQGILKNAIKVLRKYYDNMESSLLQSKEDPAPPQADFNMEGQSKDGGNAVTMLQFILKEAEKEEESAHADEEKDQADYEDSMTELKEEQAQKEKSLGELQEKVATAAEELLDAEEDHKTTTKDKDSIEDYLAKIKPGCDFIDSNFQLREDARANEKGALETAMSTLKGSPAYQNAVADATAESYGKCKDKCLESAVHVDCKACMADTTVSGYCAGHKDVAGC